MRAVTWHGRADVRVDTVPDPVIQEPTDVIIEVTSSGICGSDLHLIEVMAPFMSVGDVMGHEPMGIVREVGSEVTAVKAGDRVVVPFNISCNTCWMCSQGLQSQCETTQNREQGFGASLFGYTKLYGQVPGGQAEYLRVPFGNTLPIKVPDGPRPTTGSSTSPTSCRRRGRRCSTPASRRAAACSSSAWARSVTWRPGSPCTSGAGQVFGADVVPERLARARARGVTVIDSTDAGGRRLGGPGRHRRPRSGRRHRRRRHGGARLAARLLAQKATAVVPDAIMEKVMQVVGVDRLAALNTAIEAVRRGGTISLSGVYGGATDPHAPDAHVRQADPAAHGPGQRLALGARHPAAADRRATRSASTTSPRTACRSRRRPQAYMNFREKKEGTVKVLLQP